MSKFLSIEDVITIHALVVDAAGGSQGIRDRGLLESAVMRPQATFDGKPLYPDVFMQAAALLESLTRNHPFVDGNKRTGYVSMVTFLELNDFMLSASNSERFELVIRTATGELKSDAVAQWLMANTSKK